MALEFTPTLTEKVKMEINRFPIRGIFSNTTNAIYEEYNKTLLQRKFKYNEFVEYLEETLGPLATFLILLKNYNDQVLNGGHHQYLINNYASKTSYTQDLEFHHKLNDLYQEFIDEVDIKDEDQKESLEIIRDNIKSLFRKIMIDNNSRMEITFYDVDERRYWDEDIYNDNYEDFTEDCKRELDYLDNSHYKHHHVLESIMTPFLKKKLKIED